MSASVTPSSPIVTISGRSPSRRRPLSRFLPKIIGLPCSRTQHPVVADLAVGECPVRPVVEDVAVLEDLDEDRAVVAAGPVDHVLDVVGLGIDRAGDEARLGGQGDHQRVDRVVDRPERRRLRLLAELRGGRGLAFGEAVDPVVEHHDVDVDVLPHRVQDVVPADRERVAVPGDDPDHQLRPRQLEAGGDRGRPAVDRVEAVRVHVVREAAGAADAADEDDVLLGDPEVGHHLLRLGQDRVVAAARAPLRILDGEVLAGELGRRGGGRGGFGHRAGLTGRRAAARPWLRSRRSRTACLARG